MLIKPLLATPVPLVFCYYVLEIFISHFLPSKSFLNSQTFVEHLGWKRRRFFDFAFLSLTVVKNNTVQFNKKYIHI